MSASRPVDFLSRAVPGVQGLHPYQPGKPVEELERELGIENAVKLASNENPLGPSPLAAAALNEGIADLERYPDGGGVVVRRAIAEKLGVGESMITLGNGSNDVLDLIARTFAGPGDEVVFSEHAFAVYPIATQAVGATAVQVPAVDFGSDLKGIADALSDATRVIFLANPNNPTGTWNSAAEIESLLATVPSNVVFVLDEAYAEYFDDADRSQSLAWLEQYPNLVLTRTFSKIYGLAALRIGYAISGSDIADLVNRVRHPFNVNSLAQRAAVAALNDTGFLARSREANASGMRQLEDGFARLNLGFIPSRGNFISVDTGRDAGPVFEALLREGVIVRPVANYGLPTHLRVTVGTRSENEVFLAALERVLAKLS